MTHSADLVATNSTDHSTAQLERAPVNSLASPGRLRLAAGNGWHRISVFYEVMVRSFAESDGDGIGDLAGLRSRLDYLAWLGVDCLWLPPFYPSPLRDGGYDVADLTNVDPAVGAVADFSALLERSFRVAKIDSSCRTGVSSPAGLHRSAPDHRVFRARDQPAPPRHHRCVDQEACPETTAAKHRADQHRGHIITAAPQITGVARDILDQLPPINATGH